MGNWQNRPERTERTERGAPERRRQQAPFGDDDRSGQAPMRRPGARSTYAPDEAYGGRDGRPATTRSAHYPPNPSYPLRAPAAPSRPLRPGLSPASYHSTGAPPPMEPPTPGWRRWLPIISGAVAGVVVVAIALTLLALLRGQQQPTPTTATLPAPTPTAQALCADLLAQRYTAAYGLLTPDLRRQGTEAQYVASQRELDALQGRVTACVIGKLNVSGVNTTGALTITRARTHAAQATLSLVWNGSSWQISAYDTSVI